MPKERIDAFLARLAADAERREANKCAPNSKVILIG